MKLSVSIDDAAAAKSEAVAQMQSFVSLAQNQPSLDLTGPSANPPAQGEKGAGIDLATVGLALVTSGAVTALVQILQHCLARNKKAAFTFEAPDGRKLSVSSSNVRPEEVEETARRLQSLFDESAEA